MVCHAPPLKKWNAITIPSHPSFMNGMGQRMGNGIRFTVQLVSLDWCTIPKCLSFVLLGGVWQAIISLKPRPHPSHDVKGLVAVEWFLGYAESTVLILECTSSKCERKPPYIMQACNFVQNQYCWLGTTKKSLNSHQALFQFLLRAQLCL